MEEKQDDNLLIIEKDKDKSNLVTDENMQGFVYDIHDVIETSQERPAIKARNLIQAGVSMELFVAAYTNMTPNVTKIDEIPFDKEYKITGRPGLIKEENLYKYFI